MGYELVIRPKCYGTITDTHAKPSRIFPHSPIDESLSHNPDRTSQDSRESIELKIVQQPGESAAPLAQRPKKSSPPPNSKVFNSNQQTRKLFFPQFFGWLGTVVFVAFLRATLKVFENKGNFSNNTRHLFNTIITALSLGLGLNFFVSFVVYVEADLLMWFFMRIKRSKIEPKF